MGALPRFSFVAGALRREHARFHPAAPAFRDRRLSAMKIRSKASTLFIVSALTGAAAILEAGPADLTATAANAITVDELFRHVRVLASDEFEGRAPGTAGEEKTVAYLVDELKKLGLAPGNPDGTYVQDVPAVGFSGSPTMSFAAGDRTLQLTPVADFVANSQRLESEVRVVDSEMIFVGYGVVAPEFGWDDFKDVDVRGKTILMLVGDPPVPDPADPSKLDENVFRGRAMTYYGRWTYKYEIAATKGAAAAIIVHETEPASYPWQVISASHSREALGLVSARRNTDLVAVQSWITLERASELVAATGRSFADLKQAAARRDFRPLPLGARASVVIHNHTREARTRNVIGCLEGSDPVLKNEYVIFSAHWDHLGRDPHRSGDPIFHGASDNASGVAGLFAIARAMRALPQPPRRSVLFLFPTAEEKGLLGARYYAMHPLHPLERTVAVINIDGLNASGPTRDITLNGDDNSTLIDLLRAHVATQGRRVAPDPKPEAGFYYRADHFEFAKVGVPALYVGSGVDFVGKPEGWGLARLERFFAHDYHQPGDMIKPDWTFEGGVLDARLLFAIGLDVANADPRPEWKPGSEFKPHRAAMPGR
jgi:Zn-dependent M28 family amino/carboxypeptidase